MNKILFTLVFASLSFTAIQEASAGKGGKEELRPANRPAVSSLMDSGITKKRSGPKKQLFPTKDKDVKADLKRWRALRQQDDQDLQGEEQ